MQNGYEYRNHPAYLTQQKNQGGIDETAQEE